MGNAIAGGVIMPTPIPEEFAIEESRD